MEKSIKKGKRVRIKTYEEIERILENGIFDALGFAEPMKKYCGKSTKINNYVYQLNEGYICELEIDKGSWNWHVDWLNFSLINIPDKLFEL